MQKFIQWSLTLLYAFGTIAFFMTGGSLVIAVMLGESSLLLLILLAGSIYFYSIKKIRELLSRNEKVKAYLMGNGVVWILTLAFFGQCATATFSTH